MVGGEVLGALAETPADQQAADPLAAARDVFQRLASLREPVDSFFDKVLVMDEDAVLRENRLALLSQMRQLFLYIADLSKLGG